MHYLSLFMHIDNKADGCFYSDNVALDLQLKVKVRNGIV